MKTKAKLVLALSVLTAGTAVAGATGTFAWFTTNRSATLTYTKITAQSSNAKLEVTLGGITDDGLHASNYESSTGKFSDAIKVESNSSFTTDVSSVDGKKFFKPDWKGVAGNEQQAYSVKEVTDGYTQFYFTVKNTGNTATHVFFNEGTAVNANATGNDADVALAKWTRVAVLEAKDSAKAPVAGDTADATLKVLFENVDSGSTKTKGIAEAALNEGKPKLADVATVTHKLGAFDAVVSGTTKTTGNVAYLGELTANATKAYIVSVWLEGTESDNQDAAAGGAVDVTLKLTGIETVGA